MSRVVQLGAPSLTKKDANELVSEVFGDAKYPLTVTVKNHMPMNVALPEVGLFLRHVSDPVGSQAVVNIASADLFHRLASSVEQVAELNRYEVALSISDDGLGAGETDAATVVPPSPKSPPKKAAKTQTPPQEAAVMTEAQGDVA